MLLASHSYVLVTVGSTLFESLIEAIDNQDTVRLLRKHGFSGLHVQYGKGTPPSHLKSVPGFEIRLFDYLKSGWKEEMENASLVIGHAGAGTILDSLEARKPIVVVANDKLMSQHQTEISNVMEELGHLFSSTPSALMDDLPHLLSKLHTLAIFPEKETNAFAREVSNVLREESRSPDTKSPSPKSPTLVRRKASADH